jgi:hypothetical protein
MKATDALDKGREAFERQAWVEVYTQLSAASRDAALEPEDLERFATAAFLLGKDVESNEFWARATNSS